MVYTSREASTKTKNPRASGGFCYDKGMNGTPNDTKTPQRLSNMSMTSQVALLVVFIFIPIATVGYINYSKIFGGSGVCRAEASDGSGSCSHGGAVAAITNFSEIQTVKIGENVFPVEIADTEVKRETGLSGRTSLPHHQGMLFVFDTPGTYGFWMKDMKIPIDIVWIGANMRVLGTEKNVSPDTFPRVFYPPGPVRFVLEIAGNSLGHHHIGVGDVVEFLK